MIGRRMKPYHYCDVTIGAMTSQTTRLTIVYSTVYSGIGERKHQSSPAFLRGIHRVEFTGDAGQWRGNCFHLMTSSWIMTSMAIGNAAMCQSDKTRHLSYLLDINHNPKPQQIINLTLNVRAPSYVGLTSVVIMGSIASQITSLTIVYSIVYSEADQRKHQSSASLAVVRGIHRTGEFPVQMASNAENVSIWRRHHVQRSNKLHFRTCYLGLNLSWTRYCAAVLFSSNTKWSGWQFVILDIRYMCLHVTRARMLLSSLLFSWWRHQMETFPRYWPFVRGIHRSPVNSSHKGQWRGALMFSLICAGINGWVNNLGAGDLIRHRTHHDVIVMLEVLIRFFRCRLPCLRAFEELCHYSTLPVISDLTRWGLMRYICGLEWSHHWFSLFGAKPLHEPMLIYCKSLG